MVASAATFAAVLLGCSGTDSRAQGASKATSRQLPVPSEVVVGGSPCGITKAASSIWVSDLASDRIVRVDPETRLALESYPVGAAPCWILGTRSQLWVAPSEEAFLQVVDARTGQVIETIEFASQPSDAKLAAGFGSIWATSTPDGTVVRIDPDSFAIAATVRVGVEPRSVVVGGGLVWVAVEGSNKAIAIDPQTNKIERSFHVAAPSSIIAATRRDVWVGQLLEERVTRLSAARGRVIETYDLQSNPQPGRVLDGIVWSPDHLNSELLLFPVAEGEIDRVAVGRYPSAVVRFGDQLWVANFGDGTVSIIETS